MKIIKPWRKAEKIYGADEHRALRAGNLSPKNKAQRWKTTARQETAVWKKNREKETFRHLMSFNQFNSWDNGLLKVLWIPLIILRTVFGITCIKLSAIGSFLQKTGASAQGALLFIQWHMSLWGTAMLSLAHGLSATAVSLSSVPSTVLLHVNKCTEPGGLLCTPVYVREMCGLQSVYWPIR